MNPRLSIIIPAFNEEKRIGKTLEAVDIYVKRKNISSEIIVVDDGSKDETVTFVKKLSQQIKNLHILQLPKNEGKGAAVKAGMLAATGDLCLFMDADNSTDIAELEKLLPHVSHFDVVISSRRIADAKITVTQSFVRELLGHGFRALTRAIVKTDMKDTQNGFKLFSKKAAKDIFNVLETKGWSFDVEVLMLAKKFDYKVKEVPIVWANDPQSRLTFFHMIQMLFDLFRIRKKYKTS